MKLTKEYIKNLIAQNDDLETLVETQIEVDQETFNMLGVALFNRKEISRAEKFFKNSLLMNLANPDELFNLGVLNFSESKFEKSYKYFKQAKKITSNQEFSKQIDFYLIEIMKNIQSGIHHPDKQVKTFLDFLVDELLSNIDNCYFNNIDTDRYTANEAFMFLNNNTINMTAANQIVQNLKGLSNLYENLADVASKELMVKVMVYRILGPVKMKLPLNRSDYWVERNMIYHLQEGDRKISIGFKDWELQLYNLRDLGYPIKMFYLPLGIQATFGRKQYEHPEVKVEEGDYIIDAGGCFGDTALFFAQETGSVGKVFTFEFIKSNLLILNKNIEMNPSLVDRITVVNHPLWDVSGNELYYVDNGPGSSISNQPISNMRTSTVAIDNLVFEKNIEKIDFIKMDIEGAELNALKGAKDTIVKYRPKMAISVYHSMEDFSDIIQFIMDLDLDYSFYLDHFTIYGEETILFAKPNNRNC